MKIFLLLLAGAAAVIVLAMLPPVVGIGNNGDFGKIALPFDLYAPVEDELLFAPVKYAIDPARHWNNEFVSSEALFVPPALAINRLVSPPGVFDIRALGILHAGVYLFALAVVLVCLRSRPFLAAAVVLVLCDVMYVAYFNSFFMDAAALVSLAAALALLLYGALHQKPAAYLPALVLAGLFATSKTQHAPAGLVLSAYLAWKLWTASERALRWTAPVLVGAILGVAIYSSHRLGPAYRGAAAYNLVFSAILPRSSDVPGDLARLGLESGDGHRVGTHAYSPGSPFEYPETAREFSSRLSLPRIGLYYATHPLVTWQILRDALWAGSLLRSDRQGNYDRGAGRPPYAMSYYFAPWSIGKYQVVGRRPLAYLLFFLASAGVLAAVAAGRKLSARLRGPALVLVAVAGIELAIATLGDAAEITRHLFIYNFLSDVVFLAAVWAVCWRAEWRRMKGQVIA